MIRLPGGRLMRTVMLVVAASWRGYFVICICTGVGVGIVLLLLSALS